MYTHDDKTEEKPWLYIYAQKTHKKTTHEKTPKNFKAACRLQIRSLLDVASEAVVDMIIGKTPEEINRMFNIKQDITFEEIVEVFETDNWCFE
ncbi:S-phase kinase-associated protein 1 [Artemisia annua]|uniref:S-phase kinase-associated protein 1 n=1 Tax=Artemisia annua TaxID=35608 RepID=A0A2U1PP62_ARTAN|nr:S-phase kinase-associated protein 1 [Artemisia annua]